MKMKKISTFAVTSLMALAVSLTLASCSSDDIIENSGENTAGKNPTVQTVFSCGDDDLTRTSINNKRAFFWEKGDKIWIYDGSQWQKSTKSDIAAPQTPQAKFTLNGSYDKENYQLLYTGYTNGDTATTQYNKVTIADVQTQKAWNDGSHLGTSGDCGTARAYRQANNTYRFSLEHKASYLLFYPFLHTDLTGDYTLEKIEVYSDLSASTIAGTFDFDFTNGLLNSDGTPKTPDAGTAKQEMTLNCGNLATGEFGLPKTAPNLSDVNNAAPHCLMVIAPGDHQLTIRYVTKKSDGTQHDFIKDIALKQYKPNGVYTFVHELQHPMAMSTMVFNERTFYQWGCVNAYTIGTTIGGNNGNYYLANHSYLRKQKLATADFWPNLISFHGLCTYIAPVERSYIFWDNAIQWKLNMENGTQEVRRGGLWIRKMQYNLGWIYGFNNSYTNARFTPIKGRPEATDLYQYFFLPALEGADGSTVYWSRERDGSDEAIAAGHSKLCRTLTISSAVVVVDFKEDSSLRVAGTRPDGKPWFQ